MKRTYKTILSGLITLILIHMLYLIMALLLGLTPVNRKFQQPINGIEIFIRTNGVHTDFVLPAKSEHMNWYSLLPATDYGKVDTTFNYVSFGWGDKGFYIDTPTWADLKVSVAFKALYLPSPTAMHVEYIASQPTPSKYSTRITISEEQYVQLTNFIKAQFQTNDTGNFILIPEKGYHLRDNFYEAHGKYHLFNTCNNWTNRLLKKTGIRTAVWSPFDKAIMYQLKRIKSLETGKQ